MKSVIQFHSPFSPKFLTYGIFSLLGLGFAPTACGDQPELDKEPVVGCMTDAECGEGVCRLDGTCSDGSCTTNAECGGGQFCASWGACEAACSSCGNSCTMTSECPAGQHCSNNTCQQECQPGSEGGVCGDSLICNDDGKCASNDTIVVGTGGDTGLGEGGMGGGSACIDVEVDFEPEIPNVVLLIDQSGSMNEGDGFGQAVDAATDYVPWDCTGDENWRWNVVRNVLLHPENGVVKPLENAVRFGMALYSSDNGFSGGTCPLLTEVAVDFGNHQTMLDNFECSTILNDTPTRESLTATAEALAAAELDGPKIIVLATDGAPDNCTCDDWSQSGECANSRCDTEDMVDRDGTMLCPEDAEQYDVVIEAQRIHEELGITIEVINVSNPSNATLAAHLDDVAERGGAVSGASIDGFNPTALTDAFQTIIDGVRSCVIDLNGSITAGKEDKGTVTLDGEELLLDDPDGWKVNSPTQIELLGAACDTIKSGDHDIDIDFPCDAFVPVPVK